MADTVPSPPRPHLALLASWALTQEQRRLFAFAYRRRDQVAQQMSDLADAIVARAEALTHQDHPNHSRAVWSGAQTDSFNRWLQRLMTTHAADAMALNKQHQALSECVEDLARSGRFRSSERLAEVLMLDRAVELDAANER